MNKFLSGSQTRLRNFQFFTFMIRLMTVPMSNRRVTLVHVLVYNLHRYTEFERSQWSPQAKILLTIRTFNWHKLSFSTALEWAWVRCRLIWFQSLIDYSHLKMYKERTGIIYFTFKANKHLFWKATFIPFLLKLVRTYTLSHNRLYIISVWEMITLLTVLHFHNFLTMVYLSSKSS